VPDDLDFVVSFLLGAACYIWYFTILSCA